MNILVTLDKNYLKPLRIMLGSMFLNNPGENFNIYIAADGIDARDLHGLDKFHSGGSVHWHFVDVDESQFGDAPTLRYYSRAMYYRLLAAQLLPEDVDKILYLDPDILVIGKLRPLYETKMDGYLYAAAMHKGLTGVSAPISKIRIPEHEADSYFNSGVLLMNLKKIRQEVNPADVFEYVRKHHQVLVLPDQDVLNGLYGTRILPLDESIWNYDARKFETYRLTSQGKADMDWTMHNTSILHFCGKKKPWNAGYRGRFSSLYKHYQALADRSCE